MVLSEDSCTSSLSQKYRARMSTNAIYNHWFYLVAIVNFIVIIKKLIKMSRHDNYTLFLSLKKDFSGNCSNYY